MSREMIQARLDRLKLVWRELNRLKLAIVKFDADTLVHKTNGDQETRLVFTPNNGTFKPCKRACLYTHSLARLQTAFDRQWRADLNQFAYLAKVRDKHFDFGDRCRFRDTTRADGLIASFVVTPHE